MKIINPTYRIYILLFILIATLPLAYGMMEPDGALYATIAKYMLLKNDWSNLYFQGKDWLDKPHFQFWITAISYKIFGINSFAYKLPSLLVWYGGVYYVYLIALFFYNKSTASLSALLYITATHVLVSNFDVRAEAYVTTFSIATLYHLLRLTQSKISIHSLWAGIFAACAICTKGIFVLIPVIAGFVCYWLWNKDYKQFIQPKYWLVLFIALLGIGPELYALYLQFDLHPEKLIFNKHCVSGIRFFFWDSQFGRFFNNGPIKGKGDISFFVHTTLWAFLPWSLLLFAAVFQLFRKIKTAVPKPIAILYGSAIVTFLMFSLSKFQLPHYILILIPHFAIITAHYILELKALKPWITVQRIVLLLSSLLLCILAYFFQHAYLFIGLALLVNLLVIVLKLNPLHKLLCISCAQALLVALFLYLFLYPQLLPYQSGQMAGKYLQQHPPQGKIFIYKTYSYTFDFYAPGMSSFVEDTQNIHPQDYIYFQKDALAELQQRFKFQIIATYPNFHITKLTKDFINPNTRAQVCDTYYLAQVQAENK